MCLITNCFRTEIVMVKKTFIDIVSSAGFRIPNFFELERTQCFHNRHEIKFKNVSVNVPRSEYSLSASLKLN